MSTPLPVRAMEASAVTYRALWWSSFFTSVLSPVLFLAAMGLGLGSLVDGGEQADSLGGVDYLSFLAPGLLAAAAMQMGANEGLWPVMAGIKWRRNYHAMLATPLRASDVAIGTIGWIGVRVAITSASFLVVMVLFGAAESPWVALALPVAVLIGLAHGAPLAAYTATVANEYGISNILRFVVIPMFLFSGTFFPVDQLPDWVQPVAYVTPLWHGVTLCRSLALGDANLIGGLGHVAYLTVWVLVGARVAVHTFQRRLVA